MRKSESEKEEGKDKQRNLWHACRCRRKGQDRWPLLQQWRKREKKGEMKWREEREWRNYNVGKGKKEAWRLVDHRKNTEVFFHFILVVLFSFQRAILLASCWGDFSIITCLKVNVNMFLLKQKFLFFYNTVIVEVALLSCSFFKATTSTLACFFSYVNK